MENPATWNDVMKLLNSREFKSAIEVFEILEQNGYWRHFYFDLIERDLKLIESELFIEDPKDPRLYGSFGSRAYWKLKEVGAVE